jgi:transposase
MCVVVAPSLILRKPGERIKTDRRDASNLARLHRAGELTSVWVPDPAHEAMRDLARARLAAVRALRQARQQLSGFLLRHGRYYNRPAWTLMHRRWLAGLRFDQEIHHVVLEDWSAIGLGFAVTPLFTMTVGRDFDLLATGVFGGTAAYVIGRIWQPSSA